MDRMNTHLAILTRSWTAFPAAKVGDRIELTDDQLTAGRCADGDLYRLVDEPALPEDKPEDPPVETDLPVPMPGDWPLSADEWREFRDGKLTLREVYERAEAKNPRPPPTPPAVTPDPGGEQPVVETNGETPPEQPAVETEQPKAEAPTEQPKPEAKPRTDPRKPKPQ